MTDLFSNTTGTCTDNGGTPSWAPRAVWVPNMQDVAYGEFARRLEAGIPPGSVVGFDTEFYGCDISEESPVGKAVVDVFSVAVPGRTGYQTYVFDGGLLRSREVTQLLGDGSITKCIHNQPADAHAVANHGVVIRGGLNTLSMARFVYPERANLPRGNYDLDSLCRWRLGIGKTEDFDAFLGYDDWDPYETQVEKKLCECGKLGCRKKKGSHQSKSVVTVDVTRTKKVRKIHHLPNIRPDGPLAHLFPRYLVYAAADAELSLRLYRAMLEDAKQERRYPYPSLR